MPSALTVLTEFYSYYSIMFWKYNIQFMPLPPLYTCSETKWAEGVATLFRAGSDSYVLLRADSYLLIFHNPSFLENTNRKLHERRTHMERCYVWLREGNHRMSAFAYACICFWLLFHCSHAHFKSRMKFRLGLSQAPTYKFSLAILHLNTLFFLSPVQYVCNVVAATVVLHD